MGNGYDHSIDIGILQQLRMVTVERNSGKSLCKFLPQVFLPVTDRSQHSTLYGTFKKACGMDIANVSHTDHTNSQYILLLIHKQHLRQFFSL